MSTKPLGVGKVLTSQLEDYNEFIEENNSVLYILKRKRNATVFNPLFLPHISH